MAVLGFFRRFLSLLLHLHFRLTRGLTLGVRAVVISTEGKILLVRHSYTPGWHFPGGGVETGESAENALSKELWQETGLTLVGKPRLLSIDFNSSVSDRDHVLTYICETKGVALGDPPSFEISELDYFSPDSLPSDANPMVRQVLAAANLTAPQ